MNNGKAKKPSIAQWDEADRPREKLADLGPAALSNAELLAILIGSGSVHESAVDLTRRLLADCAGSLNTLGKKSIGELCTYNGIGPAKAVTIMAACEFGKRRAAEPVEERPQMTDSEKIYRYFLPRMQDLATEECHVLLLNQSLRILGTRCVSRGGISETAVDVRIVLREALLLRATNIALCHNHPSGNSRPSRADDQLTQRMKTAAEAVQIRLTDHIILTDGNYYSYCDEGRL